MLTVNPEKQYLKPIHIVRRESFTCFMFLTFSFFFFTRRFVLIFYMCLHCLDKHTWFAWNRFILGWVIDWVQYKILPGKEGSDGNATIRNKCARVYFQYSQMYGHLSKNDPPNFIRKLYYILFSSVFSHIQGVGKGCNNALDWCISARLWKLTWNIINRQEIPQSYYLAGPVSGWYCFWKNFSKPRYHLQICMQLLSCCFNRNRTIILVSVCERKGRLQKTQLSFLKLRYPAGLDSHVPSREGR